MGEQNERSFQYEHEEGIETIFCNQTSEELIERALLIHKFQERKKSCGQECQKKIRNYNRSFTMSLEGRKKNYSLPAEIDQRGLITGKERHLFISTESGYDERIPGKSSGTGVYFDSETIFTNWHNVSEILPVDRDITQSDLNRIHIFDGREYVEIVKVYFDTTYDAVILKIKPSDTSKDFIPLQTGIDTSSVSSPIVLFGSTTDSEKGQAPDFDLDIYDPSTLQSTNTSAIGDLRFKADGEREILSVDGFAEPGDSGSGVYSIDGDKNPLIGVVFDIDCDNHKTKIIPVSVYLDLLAKNEGK